MLKTKLAINDTWNQQLDLIWKKIEHSRYKAFRKKHESNYHKVSSSKKTIILNKIVHIKM